MVNRKTRGGGIEGLDFAIWLQRNFDEILDAIREGVSHVEVTGNADVSGQPGGPVPPSAPEPGCLPVGPATEPAHEAGHSGGGGHHERGTSERSAVGREKQIAEPGRNAAQ